MKCIHPTLINDKGLKRLVPCGRCAWCRKRKRDEWFVRFLSESMRKPCYFITLTYQDDFIPTRFVNLNDGETFVFRGLHDDYIDDEIARIGSVPLLEDWQKYVKRVRKRSSFPLMFFFVSEYGKLYGRVHYHALVWSDDPGISSVLCQEWPFGDSVADSADIGSMKYVTKYILKGSDKKSNSLRDDNLKTNSAGIGAGLWPNLINHYKSENYESTFQYFGSFHSFPAYYKKKIREYFDNICDSVAIEVSKDSEGNWKVKNRHCALVQYLDEQRQIPSINDKDVIHSLLKLKVRDLPGYLYDLYMKDYNKQIEINSKINVFLNQ